MIVVSNSSPLIALARVGRLNLLASLFQRVLGYALYLAQAGRKHDQGKPLKGFGSARVPEIVADWSRSTYCAVYTVECEGMVFVLHVFRKKSKRGMATPKVDMDRLRERLKVAEQIAKESTR